MPPIVTVAPARTAVSPATVTIPARQIVLSSKKEKKKGAGEKGMFPPP